MEAPHSVPSEALLSDNSASATDYSGQTDWTQSEARGTLALAESADPRNKTGGADVLLSRSRAAATRGANACWNLVNDSLAHQVTEFILAQAEKVAEDLLVVLPQQRCSGPDPARRAA